MEAQDAGRKECSKRENSTEGWMQGKVGASKKESEMARMDDAVWAVGVAKRLKRNQIVEAGESVLGSVANW